MKEQETGSLIDWVLPLAFIFTSGWLIWHIPNFILDFSNPKESLAGQLAELMSRKDLSPDMDGLLGGYADAIDWAALILTPLIFVIGTLTVRRSAMEYEHRWGVDKIALFVGRITMMLIISMTLVMLYEVFMRYALEAPTLWANELTLWISGFVFLLSGFYAMQQRSHIRIFILYEFFPRWIQHLCDILSVLIISIFAFFLVFGSYKQIFINKFYKWEMLGTAFDPPIPATIQPMILIVVVLIAIQSFLNLIADWHLDPSDVKADDIDQDEIEAIKRSVGTN